MNYKLFLEEVRYGVLGIASFVSTMGCETGTPHVFTRVSKYHEWIQAVTEIEVL